MSVSLHRGAVENSKCTPRLRRQRRQHVMLASIDAAIPVRKIWHVWRRRRGLAHGLKA